MIPDRNQVWCTKMSGWGLQEIVIITLDNVCKVKSRLSQLNSPYLRAPPFSLSSYLLIWFFVTPSPHPLLIFQLALFIPQFAFPTPNFEISPLWHNKCLLLSQWFISGIVGATVQREGFLKIFEIRACFQNERGSVFSPYACTQNFMIDGTSLFAFLTGMDTRHGELARF